MTRPVCTVPGNDYRQIARMDAVDHLRVGVVIPVYNRVGLLERTLAGLVAQDIPAQSFQVVVVDDGSTEDVAGAVKTFMSDLDIRLERQPNSGFGAGRARDVGATLVDSDVLLFLDSDCIPTPSLVRWHLWWHRRATNVMVVGSRRDVDSTDLGPADIAEARIDLWRIVDADPVAPPAPDGWRRLFYRRNRRLLLGDTQFRAGLTSNLSVPADQFSAVGGFDLAFRTWGGEDTELAWRLWNDGTFVVPDDRAMALHQVQLDSTDRAAGRSVALPIVADRIPSPFYRGLATHLATVPRVSWVVHVADDDGIATAQHPPARSDYTDSEVILWGPAPGLASLGQALADNPRVRVVPGDGSNDAAEAIRLARGEFVAFTTADQRLADHLLGKGVDRLDAAPGKHAVRFSYVIDGDRYLRLDDLGAVDAALGAGGLPFFGMARRRELRKHLMSGSDVSTAWAAVSSSASGIELIITDPVRLRLDQPAPAAGAPRLGDLATLDPREVARAAVRRVRSRGTRAPSQDGGTRTPETPDDRIGIEYVGLTGKQNLGDDAVQLAIQRLLPWARVGQDVRDARLLMVGGGTLINGRRYYLTRMLRQDSPVLERCLFGTGVRSPAYWGLTEPMDDWFSFMDSALHVSVRGPDSVANLRELGYAGPVEIIGDPALSLRPSADASRVAGRVVVCPVWTSGNLHGGSDEIVFAELATQIGRLRGDGHEVVLLSAFPEDDRWIIRLMREAGHPDLPYVDGYRDVDDTLRLLASADLVVAERLHAAILAAAAGTPFVALEYRPKVRDFTRSVDQEDATLRTDEMPRLPEVIADVMATADRRRRDIAHRVDDYRRLQEETATELHARLSEEVTL